MPLDAAAAMGRAVGPEATHVAWLDTETTGLAGGTGTYVFLVGLAAIDDGDFVLTQYFLRHLSAEAQMLEVLRDHLITFDGLVTFNGARFDLPLLQTRFLLSRIRHDFEDAPHLDVMSLARRLWHRRLGGYSMGLLEQMVLHVERFEDVPGWMIPSLYVQYLTCGDLDLLEPVFAHNAADLLSLISLHGLTGEMLTHPSEVRLPVDWSGLGRLLDLRGSCDAAAECYRTALLDESDPGARRRTITALARYYRRQRERQALLELWESEAERRILQAWQVLERLAMIWEWEFRAPQTALAYAERALAAEGLSTPNIGRLLRRQERLRRKSIDNSSRRPRG
jgi:tetratricopeptide (TPR) repeat protein